MIRKVFEENQAKHCVLPNKKETEKWIDAFFYWFYGLDQQWADFDAYERKGLELKNGLLSVLDSISEDVDSEGIVKEFIESLASLHHTLEEDLESVFAFDPAAKSRAEVLISYPGFYAITAYRVAHFLWNRSVPIIPRIISEHIHSNTGIDIHPGATIGKRFFIDHGTGVVIGETAIIGNNVKIYQGVTLGALNVDKEEAEVKRHPTVGDDVIIYANATILGGNTEIGSHSVIGGNVWLTNSIPDHSLVYHKSEIVIKNNAPFPEPLNFVI